MKEYLDINRRAWNLKTGIHVTTEMYDMEGFLSGKSSLKTPELELLGNLEGKKVLHLQCHFGQDTLSLARLGASVCGVDLSDAAIEKARELAEHLGIRATFVNCDVYAAPEYIHEQFDFVFTSYGTIGWLPDLDRWAKVVRHFLKPGGRFVMVDFHPVVWMFDDHFKEIAYSYFNTETIVEKVSGTYADRNAPVEYETVSWNHPTSEILQNLLDAGLQLKTYREWDYSPFDCFLETKQFGPDEYRIRHLNGKIPMLYGIVAEG